jgi:hypothetical protein
VAESVIGGEKETDKSSRASSAGHQGLGVGRKVAVGISVKRGAGIIRVEGEAYLVNNRLDDQRVGRGRATPELLPLSKVMRASSGN